MEVVLLLWLVAWVITPFVAHSKGRNAFGWFLLAVLFGLFALLLVALLPARSVQTAPVQPVLDRQAPVIGAAASGMTRDCPHCLSAIPLEAAVCRYCLRDVLPLNVAALEAQRHQQLLGELDG